MPETQRPRGPGEAPDTISVRTALGSWLEGPSSLRPEQPRGQRLGLPVAGPGSLAGVGRRLIAFALDSVMCAAIAYGLLRNSAWVTPIFALEVLTLTYLAGGSAGQLLTRLRVVHLGGQLHLWRVLLRTVLLCALIPALIWDRDGRGLHDKAAGTAILRV